MRDAIALAALLCFSSTAIAGAQASEISGLARSKPWELNYEDGACNLLTTFGSGTDAVIVRFTRTQPTDNFTLAFMGERFRTKRGSPDFTFAFGPEGTPQKRTAWNGDLAGMPVLMMRGRFVPAADEDSIDLAPSTTPEQEEAVQWMEFTWGLEGRERLLLGGMSKPMAAMRTCVDDLVRSWGYDPAKPAITRAKPASNPANWLVPGDFPPNLLRQGIATNIDFRIDVDQMGKAIGCEVLAHTLDQGLGAVSCKRLMDRAKFSPALDDQSHPVADYYVNRVRWYTDGSGKGRCDSESGARLACRR